VTAFIEVRGGIPFKLDDEEATMEARAGGLYLQTQVPYGRSSTGISFGDFVSGEWEVVQPYPTTPFSDEAAQGVIAVLVKRSKRYRTAVAARAFIKAYDLHEEEGPVRVQNLFRSKGGTVIQPGGLSVRDAERFPGRTSRIHGPGDMSLFLQESDDKVRRRELMALTVAAQELEWEADEDGYYRGPRDLCLGDARRTHPDEHFFAAMLLVPEDYAARAPDLVTARMVGKDLLVDAATVQDAHQLWDLIANPEQPIA
jgi:hypothetical protein